MDFGLEFQKSKAGFGISINEIQQFSGKTHNFEFLGLNLPKTGFWGRNLKNGSLDLELTTLRYYVQKFPEKKDNFEFLCLNLPKLSFKKRNFKNLSLDSESASLRYYVHQFSDKTNKFQFLGKNLILGVEF